MDVTLLVVDGVADSGLALMRDVFAAANLLAARADVPGEPFTVSIQATSPTVRTGYGHDIKAARFRTGAGERPDIVITPALGLVTAEQIITAVTTTDLLSTLQSLQADGVALAGACSGTFFLAEAGVLDGRDATTSWWLGPAFRARYPSVHLDESQALVLTDGVTTAGAAMAHLDLALSIVRQVSPALSDLAADYLAVGDRPRQSDVARPTLPPMSDPMLTAFDRAVRVGLAQPLTVAGIARDIGISPRSLQRLTSAVLGLSPMHYIQQVRLERAVQLLRTSDLTLTAVAHAVGYRDATTLGTLIRRRRGTTPAQLRRRRDSLALAPPRAVTPRSHVRTAAP